MDIGLVVVGEKPKNRFFGHTLPFIIFFPLFLGVFRL